jgi:Ca-activated chloride channel family protein
MLGGAQVRYLNGKLEPKAKGQRPKTKSQLLSHRESSCLHQCSVSLQALSLSSFYPQSLGTEAGLERLTKGKPNQPSLDVPDHRALCQSVFRRKAMQRRFLFKAISILFVSVAAVVILASFRILCACGVAEAQTRESQGSLQVVDSSGKPKAACPLKHTDVKVEISGFLSRVVVTQEFENPFTEKIEAVYTFPLPQDAAVDDMTMNVGERIVRGKILRREEARAVYEAAKTNGQVASLLDQERPNIFTQSVANILPGEQIKITLSYVETLKYTSGAYEFVFPMVVGPRYIPGSATGARAGGFSPDTDRVPDASRITPQPVAAGMRAGHDVSLDITVDAGVPIDAIDSKTHGIDIERPDGHRAHVRLQNNAEIPNKDFILRYDVAGKKLEDALLTHRSSQGGYFTLILQPPEKVTAEDVMPKELVFVLDTSGSMSGFPIEKAKETMKLALDNLYPSDTFNLITFSGDTNILFPGPVPATKENLRKAQAFLDSRQGGGGTEMMKAIQAALDPSDAQGHVRIVCFMTDGYVGNDMEIISEVQKHANARVFAFGIGSSVNRFLLDSMAKYGRGEVEYVALNDDGSAAARRFHERVRSPLLTDISVDWAGLPVTDVYPKQIPDVFSAKPVILTGRFTGAGSGVAHLKGMMSGRPFTRDIAVDFPEAEKQHDVLPTLWARTRVADLLSQDFAGAQRGDMKPELKETITQLGLEYRLMTQFTSFVAVEEMIVTDGGQPRRIDVPVEVPEGVNRDAVFRREDVTLGNTISTQQIQSLSSISMNGRGGVSTARIYPVRVNASAKPEKAPMKAKARSGGSAGSGAGVARPSGTVVVNGANAMELDVAAEDAAKPLSEAEQKRAALQAKVHPWILAVIDRLQKKEMTMGADEAKFIRNGNAEIQIWLADKSDETLVKLKSLGFEVILDPKSAKMVIGRLPIDKLAALAELKVVLYIAPQTALGDGG